MFLTKNLVDNFEERRKSIKDLLYSKEKSSDVTNRRSNESCEKTKLSSLFPLLILDPMGDIGSQLRTLYLVESSPQ